MMLIKPIPNVPGGVFSMTEYTGTQVELMAAGIANEAMFPVGRKRVRCSADDGETHGYHGWITHRIKGGRFQVVVSRKKDRKRRPAPWKSEADFREHVAILAEAMSASLIARTSGETEKDGGSTISYRYSRDCLQRLAVLFEEMSSLLDSGEIESTGAKKVICFPVKAGGHDGHHRLP